uniref:uncharacterized protein LOC122589087 n=1 Tax=Erigeron canadensis TaxID=72917 RepID=UPI001CB95165|nr:uncharacterized protein LOC122589087 [Erigeron canadensis]
MSDSSSSSSDDYISNDYEVLNNVVTQMNVIFNPQAIGACLNVIFDEEENQHQEASSSSRLKFTRRVISRDHVGVAKLLYKHYFAPNCTYPPDMFRRRFRMRKEMFLRIMAQDTGYQCLDAFCKCVIHLYQHEYLRSPIEADIEQLTAKHEHVHAFPGMLGSIDCMHSGWRNCPVAWQGQYTRGDKGHPTIMLEAVASYDLWIWHAYFGLAVSNDINVLNESDLFDDLLQDRAPKVEFSVNGEQFTKGYYQADGIYPE